MTIPLPDLVEEGRRVAQAARSAGVELALLGGVAVSLRCPSARRPPLARDYKDVDAVGRGSERRTIDALLSGLGYTGHTEFNALQETRLLFQDPVHGRRLDVFLDRAELCHMIELAPRLAAAGETLAPADLLLLKLQVVETNHKDLQDATALLTDHELTDDDSGINLPYLAGLVAADWGLWRTTTMVAQRVADFAQALEGFDGTTAVARVRRLLDAFEAVPKSRGWRMRARLGERMRWYELPEEGQ
jgi:hypothetical protein